MLYLYDKTIKDIHTYSCRNNKYFCDMSNSERTSFIDTKFSQFMWAAKLGRNAKIDVYNQKVEGYYQNVFLNKNKVILNQHVETAYKKYIKNSLEDMLADLVISIFDYAILNKYDVFSAINSELQSISYISDLTFLLGDVFIEKLVEIYLNFKNTILNEYGFINIIKDLFTMAENNKIDLEFYIKQKIKYSYE